MKRKTCPDKIAYTSNMNDRRENDILNKIPCRIRQILCNRSENKIKKNYAHLLSLIRIGVAAFINNSEQLRA